MQTDDPEIPAVETLPILYQDSHIVVINKPSGLLVHKSMIDRHETRFAMKILRDQLQQYVYPVHRLDKPTSGALLFALSSDTARNISEQFLDSERKPKKKYLAVVRGYAPDSVTVDHALKEEHDKMTDRKAKPDKPAQAALSYFTRLAQAEIDAEIEGYKQSRYSLLDCQAITGRKHQLRRHCKHISHPIIGDAKHGRGRHNRYFKQYLASDRLLLHAYQLSFLHPETNQVITATAPLDEVYSQLIDRFNWRNNLPSCLRDSNHEN